MHLLIKNVILKYAKTIDFHHFIFFLEEHIVKRLHGGIERDGAMACYGVVEVKLKRCTALRTHHDQA